MLQYAPNRRPLEPLPACKRHIRSRGCRCMRAQGNVKELFEFLFGASGRINRAKYWRSVLIYIGAGLMTAVILFTAAGIAAPLFVIAIVVVLLPWLLWGFSFTTERLHDRDKSAWWARGILCSAGCASSIGETRMACGNHRRGDANHPGAGGFCAGDLGIVEIGCL